MPSPASSVASSPEPAVEGVAVGATGGDETTPGEPPTVVTVETDEQVALSLPAPTLGGGQMWGDVLLDAGYRIQHRVATEDSCRLLSPRDVRLASGTFEDCRKTLAFIKNRDGVEEMSGEVVILVHGILRSSRSMADWRPGFGRPASPPWSLITPAHVCPSKIRRATFAV